MTAPKKVDEPAASGAEGLTQQTPVAPRAPAHTSVDTPPPAVVPTAPIHATSSAASAALPAGTPARKPTPSALADTPAGTPETPAAVPASLPPAAPEPISPTSPWRRQTLDSLMRRSKSQIYSLAQDLGYTSLGLGGRRVLAQRFLTIQATDARFTDAPEAP